MQIMSEPPLIYAIQAVVLLHRPNLHVFSELHLPLSRSKNVRTECQNAFKYCLYNVQAVISTLGTLILKTRSKICKFNFSLIVGINLVNR